MIARFRKLYACYLSHRASGHGRIAALRIARRHHRYSKGGTHV